MYSSNETIHFPLTGFQTGKILVSLLPEGPVGRDSCAGPHQDHRLVGVLGIWKYGDLRNTNGELVWLFQTNQDLRLIGVLGHMEIRGSKEYKWRTCVAVSNETCLLLKS